MTSSYTFHFFVFSIALFSVSCSSASHPYTLPIRKDPKTNLFYTSVGIGTPRHNFDVAIDLAGENLWYDCDNSYNSSSYIPLGCDSHSCPKEPPSTCVTCSGPFKPGCSNATCGTYNYNPLAQITFPGDMGEDLIFISQTQIPAFLSGCTNSHASSFSKQLLDGLPKSNKGMIGLARSQLAFPTQLALLKKLPPKFSLCLPSSNNLGFANFLIGPNEEHPKDVSKYVHTTPLVVNHADTGPFFEEGVPSTEHFIDVKSVKIDGNVVNLKPSLLSIDRKGHGGTKISTVTRYAELQSFVYKPFVRDFLKKAAERRLKRVASVAPFEACFDSRSIGNSVTGFAVPTIELVLQGGVQWSIHGGNSMVMAKKNVACLAFVDGGTVATMSLFKASIVIGAHQLEENLLVFDLASSKLSFSSSLLLHNKTCSNF